MSGGLKENLQWLYGGTDGVANSFELSAPAAHFKYSELITAILPGEYFEFRFKVLSVTEASKFQNALEFLVVSERAGSGFAGWVMDFPPVSDRVLCYKNIAKDEQQKKQYTDSSWYLPGQWNHVRLSYTDSSPAEIKLSVNWTELNGVLKTSNPQLCGLMTQVVGMRVLFAG